MSDSEFEKDETEIVAEDGEDSSVSVTQRIAELRRELKTAHTQSADNLTGWQRAKADLINYRRTIESERVTDRARAVHEVLREVVPVLDSFDGAMSQSGWAEADATWRTGVERIANQLRGVLANRGVEQYGATGDEFDPRIHECVGVVVASETQKQDKVATVLQSGYKVADAILRPAKVVVAQAQETDSGVT